VGVPAVSKNLKKDKTCTVVEGWYF